jgi:hypothetical protein
MKGGIAKLHFRKARYKRDGLFAVCLKIISNIKGSVTANTNLKVNR